MILADRVAYIGLGGNLPSERHGPPRATLAAALRALADEGLAGLRRSRWYHSLPVPLSVQPPFVNAVVAVRSHHRPEDLLRLLHRIEDRFGRVRGARNAARILDLDLLAVDDLVCGGTGNLILPHPRLHERAFVLLPLAELAPDWRHPVLGASVAELIARLPADAWAEPIDESAPDPTPG